MSKSFFIITLLITLGCVIVPSDSFGCGIKSTSTSKSCCKKEKSISAKVKDCCQKNQSQKKDRSCGGKCGHSNCTTLTISLSFILVNEIKFNEINFEFSTGKQKIYSPETTTSNGFYSLWVIPKIS